MNCPKCPGKLEEIKIGKKEPLIIDRCFACGGLWFDKDELPVAINKEIVRTVEFDLEKEPLEDQELVYEIGFDKIEIVCPRCGGGQKMVKKPSPRNKKVTMDYCEKCGGIWLDAGEYKMISQHSPLEAKVETIIDFFRLHFPHIFKDKE